jgi:hypothetical protein
VKQFSNYFCKININSNLSFGHSETRLSWRLILQQRAREIKITERICLLVTVAGQSKM